MTSPNPEELYLKELNLVALDSTKLLAIWCTTSGLIETSLIEMEEAISFEEAEKIRRFINTELAGGSIASLEERLLRKIASRRDSLRRLYEETLRIVRESSPVWLRPQLLVEGSRYILNQPEFRDPRKFQLLISAVEEKSNLIDLLRQQSREQRVRVSIGEKELSPEMWDCSLVSSSYVWGGRSIGTLGVLGPRRMPYGRIMGLVHRVAEEVGRVSARWGS